MTLAALLVALRKNEGRLLRGTDCRIVPTSFDPDDPELSAYPREADWQWDSCRRFLTHFEARTVMCQLPLFWQMSGPLRLVCSDAQCPIYPNEPENLPVGAAAITSGDANLVIIEVGDAARFSSYLFEKSKPLPSSWLIIHRAHGAWELPPTIRSSRSRAAQEVHLFPGVPILVQCEAQADAKASAFHLAQDFAWDTRNERPLLNSADALFPFKGLELPFALAATGACSCGEQAFTRL